MKCVHYDTKLNSLLYEKSLIIIRNAPITIRNASIIIRNEPIIIWNAPTNMLIPTYLKAVIAFHT